jgi:hypothetical protein
MLAGLVYFSGTLYWAAFVMATYGDLSMWVAVPVALLLISYLALFTGLFALILAVAVQRFGIAGVWLAPWIWVATEWLRSWLGSGFPWALLGTSQAAVLPIEWNRFLKGPTTPPFYHDVAADAPRGDRLPGWSPARCVIAVPPSPRVRTRPVLFSSLFSSLFFSNLTGAAFRYRAVQCPCSGPGKLASTFDEKASFL